MLPLPTTTTRGGGPTRASSLLLPLLPLLRKNAPSLLVPLAAPGLLVRLVPGPALPHALGAPALAPPSPMSPFFFLTARRSSTLRPARLRPAQETLPSPPVVPCRLPMMMMGMMMTALGRLSGFCNLVLFSGRPSPLLGRPPSPLLGRPPSPLRHRAKSPSWRRCFRLRLPHPSRRWRRASPPPSRRWRRASSPP
jgi:hypothetical protein